MRAPQFRKEVVQMDNVQEGELMTPMPKIESRPMTMSFFDALKKIQQGNKVTRISWANKDYCLMKEDWLTIFTKDAFHTWIINDGDMNGQDFIIVTEGN